MRGRGYGRLWTVCARGLGEVECGDGERNRGGGELLLGLLLVRRGRDVRARADGAPGRVGGLLLDFVDRDVRRQLVREAVHRPAATERPARLDERRDRDLAVKPGAGRSGREAPRGRAAFEGGNANALRDGRERERAGAFDLRYCIQSASLTGMGTRLRYVSSVCRKFS